MDGTWRGDACEEVDGEEEEVEELAVWLELDGVAGEAVARAELSPLGWWYSESVSWLMDEGSVCW